MHCFFFYSRLGGLFDREALRQIARLIDIGAFEYRHVVSQQLHRDRENGRCLQRGRMHRHLDDGDAILALHARVGIGKHDTICRRVRALRADWI